MAGWKPASAAGQQASRAGSRVKRRKESTAGMVKQRLGKFNELGRLRTGQTGMGCACNTSVEAAAWLPAAYCSRLSRRRPPPGCPPPSSWQSPAAPNAKAAGRGLHARAAETWQDGVSGWQHRRSITSCPAARPHLLSERAILQGPAARQAEGQQALVASASTTAAGKRQLVTAFPPRRRRPNPKP